MNVGLMLPCYEPLDADSLMLGMEWVRASGAWPVLRHVFECDDEAALVVDVDPVGEIQPYAVHYDVEHGAVEERYHPL